MSEITRLIADRFRIDGDVVSHVSGCEEMVRNHFTRLDEIRAYNQYKIISAMQKHRLSDTNFNWRTGYGYDDAGRDKTEEIFADVFGCEKALVRPNIVNGTHAIALAIQGLLLPGDELIYCTGHPYDTMEEIIGLREGNNGSLAEFGISYKETDLTDDGKIDLNSLGDAVSSRTRMVCIQRSSGYTLRKAIGVDEIARCVSFVHGLRDDIIVMVDNCYGEFTQQMEPTDVGADIMAGSLIKNPGGGLALTGGYVAGKAELIDRIAYRLTCPGIGADCGLTFGQTRTVLQGLFLAPQAVNNALKGAVLCAKTYEMAGCEIAPKVSDERSDIIQAVKLGSEGALRAFAEGVQAASTVDSFVRPEPSNMPGYDDKVIMASGGFVSGSSIELSADGPLREPYVAFFQGGLTYDHSKLGVIMSLDNLYRKQFIKG